MSTSLGDSSLSLLSSGAQHCFRLWVYKVVQSVTLVPGETVSGSMGLVRNSSSGLHEDKVNFLEASGAQGTPGWGVRDGEPSLGTKRHCCPVRERREEVTFQFSSLWLL